jgi:DNA polymerase-1
MLIIDADIVAYRAATSCEHPIHWGDGLWTLHAFEQDVGTYISMFIDNLAKECGATKILCCLSDKENFRKEIASFYKANRADTRKPMLLGYGRQYIQDNWDTTIIEKLEADDVIGITATAQDNCIIWSEDKDLMTVPGTHLVKGEIVEVTIDEADHLFYTQILTGDTADNYKGCPGIGAVKAERLLTPPEGETATNVWRWSQVVKAFEKAGLNQDEALLQARLAYIKRELGTELWQPPS